MCYLVGKEDILKLESACRTSKTLSGSFFEAKTTTSHSDFAVCTFRRVCSCAVCSVQCALAGQDCRRVQQLQESVQCAVCRVHLQYALGGVCGVHQVWNILAHDTGRHEIDREISAIIVLEAKSFTETRNLRCFLICYKSA